MPTKAADPKARQQPMSAVTRERLLEALAEGFRRKSPAGTVVEVSRADLPDTEVRRT